MFGNDCELKFGILGLKDQDITRIAPLKNKNDDVPFGSLNLTATGLKYDDKLIEPSNNVSCLNATLAENGDHMELRFNLTKKYISDVAKCDIKMVFVSL